MGNPGMLFAPFILSQCDVHADGIKAMNTGENVIGGITGLKSLKSPEHEIISPQGTVIYPQRLAVRKDGIDDQANRHANIKKGAHPQKVRPIIQKEEDVACGNIGEPNEIGDGK